MFRGMSLSSGILQSEEQRLTMVYPEIDLNCPHSSKLFNGWLNRFQDVKQLESVPTINFESRTSIIERLRYI